MLQLWGTAQARPAPEDEVKKRVLIFFPNTANKAVITTPVPILAGIARDCGWEVSYLDTSSYRKGTDQLEEKENTGGYLPGLTKAHREAIPCEQLLPDLQSAIDAICPDLLAITAMSCEFAFLMSFFPKLRIPRETLVVIGGLHCILRPDEVIATSLFDLVCIGQGEAVFREILAQAEHTRPLDDIAGTFFRDRGTGRIVRHGRRRLLAADQLWGTETDYSIFDDRYFLHPFDGRTGRMFWMEVARGCPYSCTYCGNSALKRIYRGLGTYVCTRPLDSVFRQLAAMVENHGVEIFNMTDECFLAHPAGWLEEFSRRYAAGIRKPFLIQTRPETVTKKALGLLQACGAPFVQVGMGVESGSERVLREVCNRRTRIAEIVRAYDLLHELGFRSNAYFMIGLPTETREEIFQTIDLCRRIGSHVNSVSIYQPLPGQPLTEVCLEKGYITGHEPLETFASASVLTMPQISREEIANLRRTFMLYARLPRETYPLIERCERDYAHNRELFTDLLGQRWEQDRSCRVIQALS